MAALRTFEQTYFAPLRAEGYFVSIFGEGSEPCTLIVDCLMYLTDVDWDIGSAGVLRIGPCDTLRENDKCVGCSALPGEERQWVRGSVMCPLCSTWSNPWALRQRHYRGVFRLDPGKPAQIMDHTPTTSGIQMTNEHQIRCISEALRHAAVYCLSEHNIVAAGWTTAGLHDKEARLRAAEASEEAGLIQAEDEWRANTSTIQSIIQGNTDESEYDDMPPLVAIDDDMPPLVPIHSND